MKKSVLSASRKSEKHRKAIKDDLRPKPFPIVGIGASAGGIKAFTAFLEHLNPNLGMAYVLIMHLSPNHKSVLAEIMQSKTKMRVQTVKDGMEVMVNNVYVIPPNTFMSLVDGHLKLAPRSITSFGSFAVDYFFTALAAIYKNNAVGVILSGTATDGTLGLKAIKAEGGITFAQDETAEFNGMPNNAFESGYVDFKMSPENIALELEQLIKTPYSVLPAHKIERVEPKELNKQADVLQKILALVKDRTGIDFFLNYKHASIYRRILRRMALNRFATLPEYYAGLKTDLKEVDALYDDFLINVTYFFRDPEFYKALVENVFPSIVKEGSTTEPVRVWIAGCSTGEEAYSVAICLIEFLESKGLPIPIQIFASDLDANAIEKARLGIYPVSGLLKVPPNYLSRYFVKGEGFYQIHKAVRQMCVFSQHNLLKDPPFSRMDLISCQNVLIYLDNAPQQRVLQTFHYALKPNGFLFLGKSETIGSSTDFFLPISKKVKIYSKKATKAPQLEFTVDKARRAAAHVNQFVNQRSEINIEKVISKLILSQFVHPCVVINKGLSIIHFFGSTSAYIQPVIGRASLNVLKVIREELVLDLGVLIQQAKKSMKPASKNIRMTDSNNTKEISIDVVPTWVAEEMFFLVVFKENGILVPIAEEKRGSNARKGNNRTILRLEEELSQSRSLVRSTNEEYETTFEELQANSEEILSSNEELQSVNEELESSKEELQSAIEELTTTNFELNNKNADLDKSEKSLRKVNEQLEQFAFISSHDLQEPLRKIQTFSDRLLDDKASLNEYARNYAKKINASSARMASLIKDLLSLSVLSGSDKRSLSVDLNQIVKDVLNDFEIAIEEKSAIVNVSTLPIVQGEPIQMNQLFHNLVSNALKFSKADPHITISSRDANKEDFLRYSDLDRDRKYVSISVGDNGIGFDDRFVDKMFILFQRLHDKRDVGGTGVGLTVCKKIVEDHGGFIYGHGEKGVGATFTIFLPG